MGPALRSSTLALGNWINFGVELLLAGIKVGIFGAIRMVRGESKALSMME
jgi:hypothetical protein